MCFSEEEMRSWLGPELGARLAYPGDHRRCPRSTLRNHPLLAFWAIALALVGCALDTSVPEPPRWKRQAVTVCAPTQLAEATVAASSSWPRPELVFVGECGYADVTILIEEAYPGLDLGHAYHVVHKETEIRSALIVVSSEVSGFDAESVVVHELGHALGLGHLPIPEAVMWHGIARDDVRRSPIAADLNMLEKLYPDP